MLGSWTAKAARASLLLALGCSAEPGTLELRVLGPDGRPTPARIELRDAEGRTHVARDALPIQIECWTTPPPAWAERFVVADSIRNPYTGRTEFYADGTAHATLAPGPYRLQATRGVEHRVAVREIELAPGARLRVDVPLERWIDMPAAGWYSADDHIHATRLDPDQELRLGRWMRAEDLHVANLLRMGTAEQFGITPQYAFGDAGAYRDGDTLLLAGQEHPRTHVLGHTITLGAREAIDRRDSYTIYRGFWEASHRLDGVSGYAHWGEGQARDGLAIDAPTGLLSFLEVLQFDLPWYDVLYELWSLGVRIAPTAGTDFPCIPSLPGRDRFYTRIEGLPTRASFVAGIRAGRTFVTNGPLLELDVDGVGMGGERDLPAAGAVRVRGRVRFDPQRDDVRALELVAGGDVVAFAERPVRPGEILLEATVPILASTWLALRASGEKLAELPMRTPWFLRPRVLDMGCRFGCGASMAQRAAYVGEGRARPAAAHTAPIWVTVAGAVPEPPPDLLDAWIARLDAFEARLADDRLDELVVWRPFPGRLLIDGVPEEALRRDRDGLRERIAEARRRYQMSRASGDTTP